jgi:dolichol-phosphate mannosyltransferase
MRITIVLPTYNEAENLPKLVSALLSLPLNLSVLVVDDHSPDGTGEIADKLSTHHPNQVFVLHRAGKLGLRSAYTEGFQKAFDMGTDAVVQMDADFSHDPLFSPRWLLHPILRRGDRIALCRWFTRRALAAWRKLRSAFGNTADDLRLPRCDAGYMWRRKVLQNMPLDRIQTSGSLSWSKWRMSLTCWDKITETPFTLQIVLRKSDVLKINWKPPCASGMCGGITKFAHWNS